MWSAHSLQQHCGTTTPQCQSSSVRLSLMAGTDWMNHKPIAIINLNNWNHFYKCQAFCSLWLILISHARVASTTILYWSLITHTTKLLQACSALPTNRRICNKILTTLQCLCVMRMTSNISGAAMFWWFHVVMLAALCSQFLFLTAAGALLLPTELYWRLPCPALLCCVTL